MVGRKKEQVCATSLDTRLTYNVRYISRISIVVLPFYFLICLLQFPTHVVQAKDTSSAGFCLSGRCLEIPPVVALEHWLPIIRESPLFVASVEVPQLH